MNEEQKGNGEAAPVEPAGEVAKAEAPVESDAEKAARLEQEKKDLHDRLLRSAADFENYKKRSRREVEDAQARGREQLAKELLPVLDNFERALQALASGGSVEQLGQGVKLVDKQLRAALEKFEIRSFDALGEPFDPGRHDAIQQEETAEHPPGTVARVFSRGYTIGQRLLRPAMVAVARPPAAKPGEGDGSDGNGAANGEGGG